MQIVSSCKRFDHLTPLIMFRWLKRKNKPRKMAPSIFELNESFSSHQEDECGSEENMYHVYTEILDYPSTESEISTIRRGPVVHNRVNGCLRQVSLTDSLQDFDSGVDAGPYLVVPISTDDGPEYSEAWDLKPKRSRQRRESYMVPIQTRAFCQQFEQQSSVEETRPTLPPRKPKGTRSLSKGAPCDQNAMDSKTKGTKTFDIMKSVSHHNQTVEQTKRFAGGATGSRFEYDFTASCHCIPTAMNVNHRLKVDRRFGNPRHRTPPGLITRAKSMAALPFRDDDNKLVDHERLSTPPLTPSSGLTGNGYISDRGTLADVSDSDDDDSNVSAFNRVKKKHKQRKRHSNATKKTPLNYRVLSQSTTDVSNVRATNFEKYNHGQISFACRDRGSVNKFQRISNKLLSDMIQRNNDKQPFYL